MAVRAQISAILDATHTGTHDLGTPSIDVDLSKYLNYVDGTGAGAASKMWGDSRTVASASNDDLDLAGSVTDAFGAIVTFTAVKAIMVIANPNNTTDLTIGAGTNGVVGWFGAATHTVKVKPGGMFMVADPGATGYPITAGTGDILRVANAAGASANYTIVVIGI